MTLLHLQVFGQLVAASAIAGGLIYAAIQFRQARKAAHVANFIKLVELQMHLREMRVNDPALAEVYRHDVQGMENDREVREYFFNLMQLSVYEIVWFSYRMEQIPEDYYRSWEKRIAEIVAEPSFRRMMGSGTMKILHDDFQKFIENLVAVTPERAKLADE
jgi:hypothetical protein